ncbi:NADH-quinone oxidoreductase subunit J [Aquisphaera giovannonii]|uniref:NADH-quinone oxidoreductase subunit J n=1 Tax=Aquisphaera giovannonii TaxID=406548 RepID=A0A5B9W1A3_9BACT|nr:NADH-quinone oxidoreductase subunit J [Aquisphaera giovannonii]QEH33750.1 NADH-quinone oxidoreductase subunit J [Aquisphaera giovannonii]
MTTVEIVFATLYIALGAAGSYLLLPHRHGKARPRVLHLAGAFFAAAALFGFVTMWSLPGGGLSGIFFYLFGIGALVGAVLTVTSRNPVYSALWFASVILSTAGLFLLAGAQFLAAGTVIVYAGAIIVTFLFVIMLAQMEGKAEYDRAARAPGAATLTCFGLLWSLIYLIGPLHADRSTEINDAQIQSVAERSLVRGRDIVGHYRLLAGNPTRTVAEQAVRPTSLLRDASGAEKPNVAGLGEALYTDHLITIELAGALLFVALIAAVVITNPRRPIRPGEAAA